MDTRRSWIGFVASLLLAAVVSGCGGGDGGTATGTLGVSITDAPACGFEAVNVTVERVRVHQSAAASESEAGWSDIVLSPARKINLLDLTNGVLADLGQTALPAGHYTQLRLVLERNTGQSVANSVVLAGTSAEIALDTPSAVQSGIKLINNFDVAAGQRVDLVLDFDACKSVVAKGSGSYSLMPVINVIPTALNGIEGFVNTALLSGNVAVSAQTNGTIVRSTVPDPQTGAFALTRLAPGNYDVVVTADNRATAVIATVPVASATMVVVSTNGARIDLPASTTRSIDGTVTLNPASSSVAAFVAAKQTFASGPTVTVKYRAADLLSGAYALTLPVGAPLLGQFGAGTLPIALVAQTAFAGKYAVEATATGYQTQSVSHDISTANATQNFTMVP